MVQRWYRSVAGRERRRRRYGTITDPAFQLGPVKNIGSTGFIWTPNGATGVQAGATAAAAVASSGGTNATTGQFMMYSGFYGPNGSNGADRLDAGRPVRGGLFDGADRPDRDDG